MAYTVIDIYDHDNIVELGGRSFSSECLIEDSDGIRMLLVGGQLISPEVFLRAHADGAQAIVCMDPPTFTLVGTFMEYREEKTVWTGYSLADEFWTSCILPASYLELIEQAENPPERIAGFVNLHNHSEGSLLDGLSTVEEIVDRAVTHDQHAVAITDHGNCVLHPELQLICRRRGVKPIFGMEAYFQHDRFARGGEHRYGYQHLVLWAMDQEGLHNLWAMSTEAYRDGHYDRKPRLDWDTLRRLNEGVLASTACLRGPLLEPYGRGDVDQALANMAALWEIFGDRLYIELHANELPEQVAGNKWLAEIGAEYNLPLIAVVDSHYATPEAQDAHRAWLSIQTNKDVNDEGSLFAGGQAYHMMSEAEVRQHLSYLPGHVVDEAISNTVRLANRCTAEIVGKESRPVYSRSSEENPDPVQHDIERVMDICFGRWEERTQKKRESQEVYLARFEREITLIIQKDFCGYFLMVEDLVSYAKREGILVGPGRGSGGGSLVAYLMGIIEIDPVEHDLLFERFMTEGRTELPDFDIDFPSSKKSQMQQYARERWGSEHVAIVGTHLRLKSKGAINDTARAMRSVLPEGHFQSLKEVSKIIDAAEAGTAGLGLSWEALWIQVGEELQPYREEFPELFEMAERLVNRLRSLSKHAAGLIIDPDESLADVLPLRNAEEEEGGAPEMVTQFDKDVLEQLGYVKFDLLNLRTLDTIQMAVDLIEERTGTRLDVYGWHDEYADADVWQQMAEGWTLGIFQVETHALTRLARQFQPVSLGDLADVITLVRPGPRNSGLTSLYFSRRNGEEEVTYLDSRLEDILSKTQGTMLYQEDIMAVCMVLGGYDSNEADTVRKILGKKKVELVAQEGEKFIRRSLETGTQEEVAKLLWEQMEEFAKYCVSGDTKVHLASSGPSSDGTVSVEHLYRLINTPLEPSLNGGPYRGKFKGPCTCCGKTALKYTRGRCPACYVWLQKFRDVERGLKGLTLHADGRIRPARILQVHRHAPAETWTMTLADGRSITATANHRHVTSEGLRRVDELSVGDSLVVDDGYEVHGYVPEEQRVTRGERQLVGAVHGAFGSDNHGFIDGDFGDLMTWTATAPDYCEECEHDGSFHRLERAHLDGDRHNNSVENLRMLCTSCHKKHDYFHNGRKRRWEKGHLSASMRIVSIEPAGVQPVYSVVMDDPHIWIGNGIATANSFNRAHAFAYAILAHWTAWLKFHYPLEFICASLSTVKAERIPSFVEEARRLGHQVLPPDINESARGFAVTDSGIRYGLLAVSGVGESATDAVMMPRPYVSWPDFLERRGPKCNSGHIKTLVRIGAFDSLMPNRRAIEALIEHDAIPGSDACVHKGEVAVELVRVLDAKGATSATTLPCVFDWESEPVELGRTGKPKKRRPLPAKCSRACRMFTPAAAPEPASIEPYTEADIRTIEMELLGVYLSSTPFDRIPPEDRLSLATATDILSGQTGSYLAAVVVKSASSRADINGNMMGFLSFTTERGEFTAVAFSRTWERIRPQVIPGDLAYVSVIKNDRGQSIDHFISLDR